MGDSATPKKMFRLVRRRPKNSESETPITPHLSLDLDEDTMNTSSSETPVKFHLKRHLPESLVESSLDDIIQKNLEPMRERTERKKLAQEIYYKKNGTSCVSPMIRETQKRPVKHRLGRVAYTGTSTSAVPPKRRLNKNITLNNTIRHRLKPINYAQMRINKIRENQRLQAAIANDSTVNMQKSVIRLRRTVPSFQVQIKNSRLLATNIKRFKLELNDEIQLQLQDLKQCYSGEKIINFRVAPETTNTSIDHRFSNLS
ncbi:unnamed protein product [Diabrotica balteata]|uniref:Uncharacterized protein n=1 Tax=Diabrotica balteata TaxID=107213 RepID=A0A9N9X9J0_DIABA|nr:unnamed protein product [Diabrotica balteata]